jgi:hypothetical protein
MELGKSKRYAYKYEFWVVSAKINNVVYENVWLNSFMYEKNAKNWIIIEGYAPIPDSIDPRNRMGQVYYTKPMDFYSRYIDNHLSRLK